ncbi:MAG: acetoacetate decarboxylase family protein [Sulfolobales archaeon]
MVTIAPHDFWSGPLTKTRKSALVPRGPWVYGLTGLGVSYKADPSLLTDVVPKPLRVSDGSVFAYITEIVTWSPNAVELSTEAPDQLYYHEGAFFVRVEYGGKTYTYCPFMWVDSDISLLRGLLVGWPKKLAKVALTKTHPMISGLDRPRKGLKLGGYVARAGSTLYRVRVELGDSGEGKYLPLLTEHPFILIRYFAGVSPTLATVNELVELVEEIDARTWRGRGEIEVIGGPNDELESLKPISEAVGYYFNMALKLKSVSAVGRAEGFS